MNATQESIQEIGMVPVRLAVQFEDGTSETKSLVFVQSSKLLETRWQLSELHDAVQLQDKPEILNRWLKLMFDKWTGSE